jgi:hypothetical protein
MAPASPAPEAPFPSAGGASRRELPPLTPPTPPPPIRLDRIASRFHAAGEPVEGQVVSRDSRPAPRVEVTLIHATRSRLQAHATADSAGRFDVSLPAGTWLVYTRTADGRDVYQGKIEVRDQQTTRIRVQAP